MTKSWDDITCNFCGSNEFARTVTEDGLELFAHGPTGDCIHAGDIWPRNVWEGKKYYWDHEARSEQKLTQILAALERIEAKL